MNYLGIKVETGICMLNLGEEKKRGKYWKCFCDGNIQSSICYSVMKVMYYSLLGKPHIAKDWSESAHWGQD